MRKPVLTSFGVLIGALALTLAVLALFRLVIKARNPVKPAAIGGGVAVTSATTTSSFPLHLIDAVGRQVTIDQPPQRIISMAPSMTELVFALGAQDRLIADTRFCIHPPEAIAKDKIGGILDPDMEKMVELHPDLILGTALTPKEIGDQIDRLGLKQVYFNHTSVNSVYRDIIDLSTILGDRPRGEKMVADMKARGAEIETKLHQAGAKRPKVLLLLRIDGLFTAGKGSFPNELIEMAGGDNIGARAATMWPQLSMETVIAENPDVIIVAIGKGKIEGDFTTKNWVQMRADPRWKGVSAVANNRLISITDDLLTIPGSRLMDALEIVATGLHPDIFKSK
jgi:iron complex transport system substrate-binding protein